MLDYLTPRQGGVYTCSTRWSELLCPVAERVVRHPSVSCNPVSVCEATADLHYIVKKSIIHFLALIRTTRSRLHCRFFVPLH